MLFGFRGFILYRVGDGDGLFERFSCLVFLPDVLAERFGGSGFLERHSGWVSGTVGLYGLFRV